MCLDFLKIFVCSFVKMCLISLMIGDECLSWVLFNKARPKGKKSRLFYTAYLILWLINKMLKHCHHTAYLILWLWITFLAASICNGKTVYGVSDTAEKLANMNIGRVTARQSFPAPMKAGGWHPGQPNLPASQEFHARRTFTRKVAGWRSSLIWALMEMW